MDANIPGYTIIREIRKGGMATVYLAIQHNLERQVALKVMSPQLAGDPSFGERFLREARITASMNHPNIVPVYDVGRFQDCHYLSMEYLPDGDLKRRISAGLDPEPGMRIILQVLDALNYVHSRSYIHRDVKPENILFRADQTAVLTDFGIAKLVNAAQLSATSIGSMVGSPPYMSPEQARGEKIDFRTDIYSLGAVMFEILAGKQLYQADSPIAIAIKHITDPVPDLPARFAGLQSLLEKMLAKNPADRYQSMLEVAQALEQQVTTLSLQSAALEMETAQRKIVGFRSRATEQGKREPVSAYPHLVRGLAPLQDKKRVEASALTLIAESPLGLLEPPLRLLPAQEKPIQAPEPATPPQPAEQPDSQPAPAAIRQRHPYWDLRKAGALAIVSACAIIALAFLPSPDAVNVEPEPVNLAMPMPVPDIRTVPVMATAEPQPVPAPERKTSAVVIAPIVQVEPAIPAKAAVDPLAALLEEAASALRESRLMQPPHANAYETYLEILQQSPGNQAAKDGLVAVAEKYLALAQSELERNALDQAQLYVDRAWMVATQNSLGTRVLRHIRAGQGSIVATHLQQCDQALAEGNLAQASAWLQRADRLANQHQLGADIEQQIHERQVAIDQHHWQNAEQTLAAWRGMLGEPDTMDTETLVHACAEYMAILQRYPDKANVGGLSEDFAKVFFQRGRQHLKQGEMENSEKLIALGLALKPQDPKLNELKLRWDRKRQGKGEGLLERLF